MRTIPELGVGIVYHSGIDDIIEKTIDLIDVIELEPQTIWYKESMLTNIFKYDSTIIQRLKSLARPIIFHGVGFPVGGTIPPDRNQIPTLLEQMDKLKPLWMSEHLSFNTVRDSQGTLFNTNFLLPPRQTLEGISYAVRSIHTMKKDIMVPFAFETGVNYLKPLPDELPDGEFVARITEATDCFILLDLHNLLANELNGRQRVKAFLEQIPLERVIEFHIAGGFQHNGYYLDAHSGVSSDILWKLTEETANLCPNLKAIIFEMLPEYSSSVTIDELRIQFERMQRIWHKRRTTSVRNKPTHSHINQETKYSPNEWEFTLGHLVVGRDLRTPLSHELASDPGIQIIRELVFHFRASSIVSTLKLSTRLLRLSLGETKLESLLLKFMEQNYPEAFPFIVAEQFIRFLKQQDLDIRYLDEIIAFEESTMRTSMDKKPRTINFDFNPFPIFQALGRSELPPDNLDALTMRIEIKPDEQVENNTDFFMFQSVLHS